MNANKHVENLQVHNIRAVKINWIDTIVPLCVHSVQQTWQFITKLMVPFQCTSLLEGHTPNKKFRQCNTYYVCVYIYIYIYIYMQCLTTTMAGHGNIRSYLHRLKIIGNPDCPCKHGIQTVDHLIYQFNKLKNERETLKTIVLKVGNWAVSKSELTNRYLNQFIRWINSMDFEKIKHYNKQM
jgi:hypothetical protein